MRLHLLRTPVPAAGTPACANSFTLRRALGAAALDVLGPWLEMLMQTRGSHILRLKGIVCIEGDEETPWAIHGVHGHLCAPERLAGSPPQAAPRSENGSAARPQRDRTTRSPRPAQV